MENHFTLIQDGASELTMIAPQQACEDEARAKSGTWNVTDRYGLIVSQFRDGTKIWPTELAEKKNMTSFADGMGIPKTLPELAWYMCDVLDGLRRRGGVVPAQDAFEMWSACKQRLEELAPRGS